MAVTSFHCFRAFFFSCNFSWHLIKIEIFIKFQIENVISKITQPHEHVCISYDLTNKKKLMLSTIEAMLVNRCWIRAFFFFIIICYEKKICNLVLESFVNCKLLIAVCATHFQRVLLCHLNFQWEKGKETYENQTTNEHRMYD